MCRWVSTHVHMLRLKARQETNQEEEVSTEKIWHMLNNLRM